MAFLGIDIGTSELKAALYDGGGSCLGSVAREYQRRSLSPELHPELLWTTFTKAVSCLVHGCRPVVIEAAAISCHGESFVPVGESDEPLDAFLLNVDCRAATEMQDFLRQFGEESLYAATGLPPHPMYTLPKILWLKRNAPRIFRRAVKFYCVEDFLLSRMGVGAWISSSLAARTMAMELTNQSWSESLLEFAGISGSHFSQIAPAGSPLGTGSRQRMQELSLPTDTLWVAGGHDQSCCCLGAGGIRAGTAIDGTGTFECISVPLDQPLTPRVALKANLPCGRHLVPNRYLSLVYTPAGAVLSWARNQMARELLPQTMEDDSSAYDVLLKSVPNEPTGLFFFPYVLGTGTPWLDARGTASILGFSASTTREELIKAALEGVTFEMRWNLEVLRELGIDVNRVFAVGGGARSSTWLQLKSDLWGCEVTSVHGEASSRGAAMCAAMGSGSFRTWQEISDVMVKPAKSYLPSSRMHARYSDLFDEYKRKARSLYGYDFHPETGSEESKP